MRDEHDNEEGHVAREVDGVDAPPPERGSLCEVVVTIIAALAIAFVVQQFLAKPYRIPSESMENTLHCGDRILVDRLSYRFSDPDRGDVVVFHPPAGVGEGGAPDPAAVSNPDNRIDEKLEPVPASNNYVKRLVALPGDRVKVHYHHLYINGKRAKEPYLHPISTEGGLYGKLAEWGPFTVPNGTYLMLGDNREHSGDGRVFGFVPRAFVVGKVRAVYWPPKRFGGITERDPGGDASRERDPACDDTSGT